MDLNEIWSIFTSELLKNERIEQAEWQKKAGIPFLYLSTSFLKQEELEYVIKKCAVRAMRGKRLNAETVFVRSHSGNYVYRHRFYVPLEKMFCCGNLCSDCIRFK
ncbi:hypothetical protein [Jeotgalibacillus sp. R-1-5s-1]|uniref:hypothetical protein n=1 Tax=Jeotgalibacillus sp. R-1-5s-1 TaxID=2555897 RepID=UPI00106B090D|nr:hypothetical protein [Jeotgalibacillus sp. R-1-5s-1]TFE03603.1 hypothetical protein E2491_02105 [Jeotgalibacillus sp. R-1-5s-1]